MPNIQFRGGRLPNDPSKPRLRLQLTGYQAVYPSSVDWLSQVPGYPMYLNDELGDCTCAAAGHMEQAWTAAASTMVTVSDSAVLELYELVSGYDPATGEHDDGAVMQNVLNQWRKIGLGGHQILGFAQLDHTDLSQIRAAIYQFGAVYVGVNFPASAMTQFNRSQDWTVVTGSPIEGGHAVNVGKYDTDGSLTCVTWGAQQKIAQTWWKTYVEEAWVVVTEEWINANGMTPAGKAVADLGAEFTQLTGEPNPFPAPAPTPEPTPSPAPTPVDPTAGALASALTRFSATSGCPAYLRTAAEPWLREQ